MLSGPTYIPSTINQALVLLHGYGSNGDDLFSLTPELTSTVENLAVFAPNAPFPIMGDGYEWFSLNDFVPTQCINETYLNTLTNRAVSAAKKVADYINFIMETHHISADKITLCGFSQGGLVAVITALTSPVPLNGLILMSAVPVMTHQLKCLQKPRTLITHGTQDFVVPIEGAALSKQNLTQEGLSVSEHISPYLGHGIDAGCMNALIHFLNS